MRSLLYIAVSFVAIISVIVFVESTEACSRDINELSFETREVFNELKKRATAKGIAYKFICGYRSQETQNKLYAKGRTISGKKVTWVRRSRHTKRAAFDVAILKRGRISWQGKDYFKLGIIGRSLGLTWGGDWKVKDYGHFELSGGKK